MKMKAEFSWMLILATICLGIGFSPDIVGAHCDTLSGPVFLTAKAALEKGDVTPVLKWVKREHEGEIREAFQKTMNVRIKDPQARELADMFFFETLVRLHRAGEGAAYTGLKPAEAAEPVVAEADRALESGSVDHLVKKITDAVTSGVRERFVHTLETRKHADESVEAGRKFVEAYVEFTHYIERLYHNAAAHTHHEGPQKSPGELHHH